ncbi:trace amine-associated receptor 1-like [Genypterus blacodes]|uniref:trace amine-associated receptor 1-like n=1 Tax=Genypterus blacodes TaxID=154954 RepID=UPI003F76272C
MTINRTLAKSVHPCYDDGSSVFTSDPSFLCILVNLILGLIAVLTVFGNVLVMIAVMYFKQLHTPTNSLILSLAVADLLVGLLVFPFSMAFSLSSCFYEVAIFCKIRGSLDITLSACSVLNLCCISIDRYYAVCKPLTYRNHITNTVAIVMILISWIISAAIGVAILVVGLNLKDCGDDCMDQFNTILFNAHSFYFPVILILCIYLKIFLVAQKQARSIQNNKTGATPSKMEKKATKTLAIVLGFFLLCWTPFILCTSFMPISKDPVPDAVVETLNWLTLSNSMLNPFIYAFFYTWFRSAFRIIFSGKLFHGDFTDMTLH